MTRIATETVDTDVLFQPIKVGRKVAHNRVFLAPMSVCYANDDGFVTQAQLEHYGRRAQGGAGMIITENFAISLSGQQLPRQTRIYADEYLPGLERLAAEIKQHGALAIMQIVHAGRYAGPWHDYESRRRLAPSAVSFHLTPNRVVMPQEITHEEIARTVAEFAHGAKAAALAGFDGVEIHGAQGFLISQFLSPRTNQRVDEWGGVFEHRARFALEILSAVRESVPSDFIVGWHLMSEELLGGGFSRDDAIRLAVLLEGGGVDFLIPVAGTFEAFQHPDNHGLMSRPRFQLEAAQEIAAGVTIPVIANGNLGEPVTIANLIATGGFGGAALARPLLADPDWPNKVRNRTTQSIRTCGCTPPTCIQTQLGGVQCHAWPPAARSRGYVGYQD